MPAAPEPLTDSPRRPQWVRAMVPGGIVGIVFIVSALAKLRGLGGFERYLVTQGLVNELTTAHRLALLLCGAELALGLCFFQRTWLKRAILPTAVALLIGFSGFLVVQIVRGDTESCHCFGDLLPMGPVASLAKNLVLLALLAVAWTQMRRWHPSGRHWPWPIAILVLSLVLAPLIAPRSRPPLPPPTGDKVPQVSPIAAFTGFADAAEPVDLSVGTALVIFINFDCDHCREVVTRLGKADRERALPPVRLIASGPADEVKALEFGVETDTQYPWKVIEPEAFYPHIGLAPPRLYLLRDGREIARWDEADFSIDGLRQRLD